MKTRYILMMALLPAILISAVLKDDQVVFSFDKNSNMDNWYILNDGVMGGVSSSSIELNDDGYGLFKGIVSTANNGGFASVRFSSKIQVKNAKKVNLRIKGDGKEYQFRVKKKTSDYQSYIKTFSTSGKWEVISIDLEELFPSFRGRQLDMPNFDASSFEELSILIANGEDESFELLIESIVLK